MGSYYSRTAGFPARIASPRCASSTLAYPRSNCEHGPFTQGDALPRAAKIALILAGVLLALALLVPYLVDVDQAAVYCASIE